MKQPKKVKRDWRGFCRKCGAAANVSRSGTRCMFSMWSKEMTTEEKQDLLDDATTLAYQYIVITKLGDKMTNEQADDLASKWAELIDAMLNGLVDDKFTEFETLTGEFGLVKEWV